MPVIRLFLAVSLDGYIADADRNTEWLHPFVSEEIGQGLLASIAEAGVLVMGRATYDQIRSFPTWPYGGKRVVILTHRPLEGAPEGVEPRGGDPAALAKELRETSKGTIWLMGGGRSAQPFLDAGLVDELQLDVIPVTLGRGLPLFQRDAKPHRLSLVECRSFETGIVRLRYRLQ